MKFLFVSVILPIALMAHAAAQDDLVHSDVPLWGYDAENVWPKHYNDETSFGCNHNIALGDWEYRKGDETAGWYRVYNYGVFHCYVMVGDAYDRDQLKKARYEPSLLINLGFRERSNQSVTLWAIQMGGRPGSDYLLLSSASNDRPIRTFDVLERNCPKKFVRSGPSLDILNTRYCAINSQDDLIKFARKMAKNPPFGKLVFVDDSLMLEDFNDQ